MKSFNPIILCAKFDWYLPSGEDFNFVYVFSLFRNYLTSGKLTAFHLNKLDFPSTKNALCQVRLNLVQCFLRRRFFWILSMNFRFFVIISFWIRYLCKFWLKLAQWLWRKSLKCEKFTDRQADGRQAIRETHLIFQLMWAIK